MSGRYFSCFLLTVDGGAGQGGLHDSRLELDLQPVLLGEVLVAVPALVVDPALEGVADKGEDNVADVAPGHLADLSGDGEGADNGIVRKAPVKDGIHGERLILGHGDDLDILAGDGLEEKVRELDRS